MEGLFYIFELGDIISGIMVNYIPIGSGIGVLLLFEVLIMGRESTAYNYRDIDHECLKEELTHDMPL